MVIGILTHGSATSGPAPGQVVIVQVPLFWLQYVIVPELLPAGIVRMYGLKFAPLHWVDDVKICPPIGALARLPFMSNKVTVIVAHPSPVLVPVTVYWVGEPPVLASVRVSVRVVIGPTVPPAAPCADSI